MDIIGKDNTHTRPRPSGKAYLLFFLAILLINAFFIIQRTYPVTRGVFEYLLTSPDSAMQRHSLYQIHNGNFENSVLLAGRYIQDLQPERAKEKLALPVPSYMISFYFNIIDSSIAYLFPFGHSYLYLLWTEIGSFILASLIISLALARFGSPGMIISIIMTLWIWTSNAGGYLLSGYYNSGHVGAIFALLCPIALAYGRTSMSIALSLLAILGRTFFLPISAGLTLYFLLQKKYWAVLSTALLVCALMIFRGYFMDNDAVQFIKSGNFFDPIILYAFFKFMVIGGFAVVILGAKNRLALLFLAQLVGMYLFVVLASRVYWDHYQFQNELFTLGCLCATFMYYLKNNKISPKALIAIAMTCLIARFAVGSGNMQSLNILNFSNNLELINRNIQKFHSEIIPEYALIPKEARIYASPGASMFLEQDYQVFYKLIPSLFKNRSKQFDIVLQENISCYRMRMDYLKHVKPGDNVEYSSNSTVFVPDLIKEFPYVFETKSYCMFSKKEYPGITFMNTSDMFDDRKKPMLE